MNNRLKKILFNLYLRYDALSPVHRGKGFLGRTLGRAVFPVSDNGVLMELDAVSALDRYLIRRTPGFDKTIHDALEGALGAEGIFVDMGANVGYYSLLAASKPGVRVVAFEPSPRELARFYRNIGLNGFSNITVFPYGLSDQRGTLLLHLSGEHHPGMNSVLDLSGRDGQAAVRSVSCPFDTFDALMPRSYLPEVRLCKIDVEGFELSVLRGMRESIAAMTNAAFVVEINPYLLDIAGCTPEDLYRFFDAHGYAPRNGLRKNTGDGTPEHYDEIFTRAG